MENSDAFVRTAAWLASLSAAAGDIRAAEGYVLGILAWYVTFGGTVVVEPQVEQHPS